MGRNMFGPVGEIWATAVDGLVGRGPPYHYPVFILPTTAIRWR